MERQQFNYICIIPRKFSNLAQNFESPKFYIQICVHKLEPRIHKGKMDIFWEFANFIAIYPNLLQVRWSHPFVSCDEGH